MRFNACGSAALPDSVLDAWMELSGHVSKNKSKRKRKREREREREKERERDGDRVGHMKEERLGEAKREEGRKGGIASVHNDLSIDQKENAFERIRHSKMKMIE